MSDYDERMPPVAFRIEKEYKDVLEKLRGDKPLNKFIPEILREYINKNKKVKHKFEVEEN